MNDGQQTLMLFSACKLMIADMHNVLLIIEMNQSRTAHNRGNSATYIILISSSRVTDKTNNMKYY